MGLKEVKGMASIYRVSGEAKMGDFYQKFSIDVVAENEEKAREYAYSLLGSRHKIKRYHIRIKDVREIPPEEAKDPRVVFKYKLAKGEVKVNARGEKSQ